MRQLLTESSSGMARKVLLALRNFNNEYFCVHPYTFTYEVTIFNPLSYHSLVRVSYELKRVEAVLKDVCDVPHIVTMSASVM